MKKIKKFDIKLSLISNNKYSINILEESNILYLFNYICISDDKSNQLTKILKFFKTIPEKCLFIDNSIKDIDFANKSKFNTILYNQGIFILK